MQFYHSRHNMYKNAIIFMWIAVFKTINLKNNGIPNLKMTDFVTTSKQINEHSNSKHCTPKIQKTTTHKFQTHKIEFWRN